MGSRVTQLDRITFIEPFEQGTNAQVCRRVGVDYLALGRLSEDFDCGVRSPPHVL